MLKKIVKFLTGKKIEKETYLSKAEKIISEVLNGIIDKASFNIQFEIENEIKENSKKQIIIEFFGKDEKLFKENEGQILESLQLYLKRVLQHKINEEDFEILIDCDGYKEEYVQSLIDSAEKMKDIAIDKGKTMYFRALPQKERKIIHEILNKDPRVKTRAVGNGLYKKIKIFPAKQGKQKE